MISGSDSAYRPSRRSHVPPRLAEGKESRVPTALMAISRRARDREGKIIEPMTLANMRENGVGSVVATCAKCRHEGVLDVQRWPADTPVPDVA
jgi:hypothetical protein